MESIKERVREIRRLGLEAKRSGEPVGQGPVPRQMVIVALVLLGLTALPILSKSVTYVRGERHSGAVGAVHHAQGGQSDASSGLAQSNVPSAGTSAEGQYRVFYAPETDLERIDRQVLSSARKRIDLALHANMDEALCGVLTMVAKSGVPVRLLADHDAFTAGAAVGCRAELLGSGAKLRVVPNGEKLLLESYVVDDVKLRSGAADLTAAGERSENADLVLVGSTAAVVTFERQFDRLWENSEERVVSAAAR